MAECFGPTSLLICIDCQDNLGGCGNSNTIFDAFNNRLFDECKGNINGCPGCKFMKRCLELRNNLFPRGEWYV